MIRNFNDKDTQRFFEGNRVKKFQQIERQAVRRLAILDNAETLGDLVNLPSNRLESLSGNRAGRYSIRISKQWRICFRWTLQGPSEVEITDYH